MEDMDREGGRGDLLNADEVAAYLGVKVLTIYRWCRDGRLPCLKVGKGWRVRRGALDDFLRRSERSQTLVSRLQAFVTVPDHVLAIAPDQALLHRLDAAFFQVGAARGGILIKVYAGATASVETLRAALTRQGLEVTALEAEGRFHFSAEVEADARHGGRAEALRDLLAMADAADRSVWVSVDWATQIDLDAALRQQEGIAALIDRTHLVVKTAVREEVVETWSARDQQRAWRAHQGLIWIADTGLTCSRVTPLPEA